jgi:hypothetical protein
VGDTMSDDYTKEQLDDVANKAAEYIMELLGLQDTVIVEQRHVDGIIQRLQRLLNDEV